MIRNWTNYFFHTDFSEVGEGLAALETDTVLEGAAANGLASILQQVDRKSGKDQWIGSGSSVEWNVNGAKVAYNGENNPNFSTNSKYSHVLVLEFPEQSVAPIGKLYLQYNL